MCYSNCKHENYDGECTKSKRTLYDIDCHCTEESDFESIDTLSNSDKGFTVFELNYTQNCEVDEK